MLKSHFLPYLWLSFLTLPVFALNGQPPGRNLTISKDNLTALLRKLLSSKEKERKQAHRSLLQKGMALLPLLEELQTDSPSVLRKVIDNLIVEIQLNSFFQKHPSPPPLAKVYLLRKLKKSKSVQEKLFWIQDFRKNLLAILPKLEQKKQRTSALSALRSFGYAAAYDLDQFAQQRPHTPLAFLVKTWLQWLFPPFREEFAKHPIPYFLPASYLISPLLQKLQSQGSLSEKKKLQRLLQQFLQIHLQHLNSPSYLQRQWGRQHLLGLGNLALPLIRQTLAKLPPRAFHLRWHLKRLSTQIRWHISDSLWQKAGIFMRHFDQLHWRQQRKVVYKLEKIGGKEAVPTLRRILQQSPSIPLKIFVIKSLSRLGETLSWEELSQLTQISSKKIQKAIASVQMQLGIQYLEAKEYKLAATSFQKVLDFFPHNSTALYNLACTYSRWKKKEASLHYLKRALLANFRDLSHLDRDPDLDYIRPSLRFRLLRQQKTPSYEELQQIEKALQSTLQNSPQNPFALYNLACTYSRLGKLSSALHRLKQALQAGFPDTPFVEEDPELENLRKTNEYEKLYQQYQKP
ncbi:MAG: hypothetical protein D6805_01285 [Planctomycetota bacterium]|nr:MAG: hypothetical protein D6805_01285 [Planctomycetota bacterium]